MKKKAAGDWKSRLWRLGMPGLFTFLVLVIVYIQAGLFPFGANSLVWGDLDSQVVPLLGQLRKIAGGQGGAGYNMLNAGGMSFIGVFLYFLASPFHLLALFVPVAKGMLLANILVMLKMVTAAVTGAFFFGHRHNPFRVEDTTAGVLGVMYTFGGFSLTFYQNLVWLDAVYLLPLLAVGVLLLFKEGRVLPYTLALAAIVVVQFQLAYMVVAAILIGAGLVVAFLLNKRDGGLFALRLGVGSLLAGLLSAAAWLPALVQYGRSARTDGLADSFWGVELKTPYETTLPILLCTSAVFAGAVALLWMHGWRQHKHVVLLGFFALLCVPLVVEPVNRMWHGGTYQAFPARYGFITLFAGLVVLAAALKLLYELPEKKQSSLFGLLAFTVPATLAVAVLLYVYAFHAGEAAEYVWSLWGKEDSFRWGMITMLACAFAFLCVFLARARLALRRDMVVAALAFLVFAQSAYNGMLYIGMAARETESFEAVMVLDGKAEVEGRVTLSRSYMHANAIGAMGYDSIAHYTSFTRGDYLTAYKKLGYSGYWMELSGFGGTAVSDIFLNVQGKIARRNGEDPAYGTAAVLWENEELAILEQPGVGYGFITTATPEGIAEAPQGDRFRAQEWVYERLMGGSTEGDIFTRYEPTHLENVEYETYNQLDEYGLWLTEAYADGAVVYEIPVGERETLYFDCFRYISSGLEEIVNYGLGVEVNGMRLEWEYPNPGANGILCLGTFEDEMVEVRVDVWRDELMRSYGVAGLKQSVIDDLLATVQPAGAQVAGNRVNAYVEAGEVDMLVLPLAYDEGWVAIVNGEKREVHRVADGFMGIQLPGGAVEVELRFSPTGLVPGLLLSLLGLAGLVLVLWRRRRGGQAEPSDLVVRFAAGARVLLLAVCGFAAFALYIVPMGLWLERGNHGK